MTSLQEALRKATPTRWLTELSFFLQLERRLVKPTGKTTIKTTETGSMPIVEGMGSSTMARALEPNIFILIEDNCLKGQRQTSLPNRLVNFQIGTAYGEIGSAVKSESKPMGGTGWCSWREYWFAATARSVKLDLGFESTINLSPSTLQYNKYLDGVPPLESQSIDQLRITFVAVLKLYLIALGERPPSQSGTLGKILPTKSTMDFLIDPTLSVHGVFRVSNDVRIWGILLNRRNIPIMLMPIELMLLAVNLNFLVFSVSLDDMMGQLFALLVPTVQLRNPLLVAEDEISFYEIDFHDRKSLGKTFKVTLDGRIQAIQEELLQFLNPNEVVLLESNEQQRLLRISLRICGTVVESLSMARCTPKCEKTVQALLCRNLNLKLATLLNATSSRRIRLQDDLVTKFHVLVSAAFSPSCLLKAKKVELIREGLVVLRKEVQQVLTNFWNAPRVSCQVPPRRAVYHKIELEPGAKPPSI
uniref:ATP synthase protein MI25 n=1 Tax=Salix viminalis TaxID=40686 RepID=A0A6N2KR45_SALVM